MGIVDFILNFAGLLLWMNWRANRFDPLVRRLPTTLMGTLRPAAPKRLRRWHLLVFVAVLLLLRAIIYWWIGAQMNWSGKLNLGIVVLWFSDNGHWSGFCHMLWFSFYSFGLMLGAFYTCLLPLSLLAGPTPVHGLVKIPLGRIDGWPRWAKVLLPFLVGVVAWMFTSWLLGRMEILPPAVIATRVQQSLVLGASTYLLWQFPLGAILLLHLLNSYIYFGKHPLWNYVTVTSQSLLRPFNNLPLRIGKVDIAPLLALTLLFLVSTAAKYGLSWLYGRLPL